MAQTRAELKTNEILRQIAAAYPDRFKPGDIFPRRVEAEAKKLMALRPADAYAIRGAPAAMMFDAVAADKHYQNALRSAPDSVAINANYAASLGLLGRARARRRDSPVIAE